MAKQIFTNVDKAEEYFDSVLKEWCSNIDDYCLSRSNRMKRDNNLMIVDQLWIKVTDSNIDNIVDALNEIQQESNIFIETVDVNISLLLDEVLQQQA